MTRAVALMWLVAFGASAEEAKAKPRVAVLYFTMSSNDPNLKVLDKGLAEMLIADLANDPQLMVIERSRIEEIFKELDLQHSSRIDAATAARVAKLLGVQYTVMGAVTEFQGTLRITAHVTKIETGALVGATQQQVKADDLFAAESKIAEALGAALGKLDGHDPPPSKKQGKLSLDSAVKYSQALDAIDKKDKKTAKEKLAEVVKAQPDFLLASLELDRLMK